MLRSLLFDVRCNAPADQRQTLPQVPLVPSLMMKVLVAHPDRLRGMDPTSDRLREAC
jgi:hypothetical protein